MVYYNWFMTITLQNTFPIYFWFAIKSHCRSIKSIDSISLVSFGAKSLWNYCPRFENLWYDSKSLNHLRLYLLLSFVMVSWNEGCLFVLIKLVLPPMQKMSLFLLSLSVLVLCVLIFFSSRTVGKSLGASPAVFRDWQCRG